MITRYTCDDDGCHDADEDGQWVKVEDLLEALQEPLPRLNERVVHPQVLIRIILRDSKGVAVYSGMIKETVDLNFTNLPLVNVAQIRVEFVEVLYR